MTPSVGRVVHYVSYGTPGSEYQSECRAAIVTGVSKQKENTVSLAVLNPSGLFFDIAIPYSEAHRGGTWHWPERVD